MAVGDSVRLELIFFTSTYRGLITKKPRICVSRDSLCRYIEVQSHVCNSADWEAVPSAALTPNKLAFIKSGDTNILENEIEITNISDQPLIVRVIDYPPDFLKITPPGRIKAGKTKTLKVEIAPSAVDTSFMKSFTLELNDAQNTHITIPVKRTIVTSSAPVSDDNPELSE